MSSPSDREFAPFNKDVSVHSGYVYTKNRKLSSEIANRRQTDIALSIANLEGKRVIDVGCGDGTYTLHLYDDGHPSMMHGIDPASEAIDVARSMVGTRAVTFSTESGNSLPYPDKSFDLAHVRGVLHHMERPEQALHEIMRVARQVIVIEPNGYNPVLKLIERFSRYHREHNEQSYAPRTVRRWIRSGGGKVLAGVYIGLVPFFCPDWMARMLKVIEPLIERLPLANALSCASYVVLVETT